MKIKGLRPQYFIVSNMCTLYSLCLTGDFDTKSASSHYFHCFHSFARMWTLIIFAALQSFPD
jgi:hypothetical protein